MHIRELTQITRCHAAGRSCAAGAGRQQIVLTGAQDGWLLTKNRSRDYQHASSDEFLFVGSGRFHCCRHLHVQRQVHMISEGGLIKVFLLHALLSEDQDRQTVPLASPTACGTQHLISALLLNHQKLARIQDHRQAGKDLRDTCQDRNDSR